MAKPSSIGFGIHSIAAVEPFRHAAYWSGPLTELFAAALDLESVAYFSGKGNRPADCRSQGKMTMRPRHLFGVLIRLGGIWWLAYAVIDIVSLLFKLDGVPTGSNYTWQFSLMGVFANLLVGFVLFFGAEYVVALAYPKPDEVDEVRRF
jgi:hypothetical protein